MIPQGRFVGPADALDDSIRSGAPEYQGGKIHPTDPAAAAKLREFWSKQPAKAQKGKKDPDDNPALSLERTEHQRRQARIESEQGDTMNRTNVNPQERALLAGMLAGGASDEALQEWRISRGINGNTFKSVVREIRGGAPPPQRKIATVQPPVVAVAPVQVVSPVRAGDLNPVINWLSKIRDMRDELAAHGVTVEGTVKITIDL